MYHTHPTTNTITFCTDLNFRFRYLYEGETHISSVILGSAQIMIGYPNLINSIHGCCWQKPEKHSELIFWLFIYILGLLVSVYVGLRWPDRDLRQVQLCVPALPDQVTGAWPQPGDPQLQPPDGQPGSQGAAHIHQRRWHPWHQGQCWAE